MMILKKILNIFADDIGIDLGTANTLVYSKNKGIVLNEPSVVAVNKKSKKVYEVGGAAKKMIGKTPSSIEAIRPLKDGVIADYEITEKMLREFLYRTKTQRLFSNTRVVICVPAGVTQVEKRAVMDVTREAGAKEAYLIEEPMAAAIGAGLEIFEAEGNMIVDVGGGTTEIAVISLGGIVFTSSLRIAGDKLDESIKQYIRRNHNLLIGDKTAEELKVQLASAIELEEESEYQIRGRNILNGLPRNVAVSSNEVQGAIEEQIYQIIEEIKVTLEKTPPELAADIYQKGLVLTGGGALIRNLDVKISEEIKIPVLIADNPLECVVEGIGILLQDFDKYEDVIISPETDY